ncbi:MAG: AraC family transcriptional regulator [Rhizobium sp.]|nr:AraC family transcriptional regulator [Rhizobium sp.]
MTSEAEYEFSWLGQDHYLALHDLVMESGEMDVEGLPTIPGGDLRNKMTYVPAGRPLNGWSRTIGRQNSFTALQFDPAVLSEEAERMLGGQENVPLIYFEDPMLLATMKKLEGAFLEGLDYPSIYFESLALVAALEVGKLQNAPRIAVDRTGRLAAAQERLLRDYIEENVAEDISLDELGRLVQLTRSHLSRRFKATFGVAPHRYLVQRRMEMAKRLLIETPLAISEVSEATGFTSPGVFIRAFREMIGVTPLVFRRSQT